ncbi:MAG: ferritin family protein [Desulfuromonadaceae bacterium]|nr:ferritin family protein [Desulfuromonadaceae bacterium]
MLNQSDLSKAVRDSIQTEKNAMDFYRLAARQAQQKEVRRVFELLAAEEMEHAHSFFGIYEGTEIKDLETFLRQPPEPESKWSNALAKMIAEPDFNERRALALAMEKEEELERHLRTMSERIADPEVKEIYLKNAEWTHNHYLLIESEYARLMGMVHETDIDTYVRE